MKDLDQKVTAKVFASGRITVPKVLRDALGWKPGTKLNMSVDGDGKIVVTEIISSVQRQKALAEAIQLIRERQRKLSLNDLTARCLTDNDGSS